MAYVDLEKARELLFSFRNECINCGVKEDIARGILYAANELNKLPTADVVEVVRCSECKKWKINPNNLYGGYCRHCEGASIDHFCSYGERK